RGKEWTYRQLHERVLRLAHGLRDLGVQRGDRAGPRTEQARSRFARKSRLRCAGRVWPVNSRA
ncbi:AMP-binding protein, partial [Nocardia sp. NPDC003999]